ncbi:uncharacterized protein BBA_03545 [Beauveria bassiana ARSEF 2860]|uniref:Uncharacterized protein n=1 Tax=Beauveria bassiana (strain ARSEF 2860) TaxID=655819 RepID=J4WCH7_BEAB2|nr:uncharacterized protein BBA_03545 [Beauveria bassiana ARSEF 2860]EJP67765.1 hypothetical protein BBA_03545 [Beauveria bassiana ARSEF 2860]
MPGPKPFPQYSIPFTGAASSSGSFQSRMPTPRSHYRELYPNNGPKGSKRQKTTHDLLVFSTPARPSAVQPEPPCNRLPQLRPENKRRPAYQAEAATYEYKFAQKLATCDDIIESDETVGCSDYESPEQADNAEPVPRLPWQVPGPLKRQPDFEKNGRNQEKSKRFMSNALKNRSYSYDTEIRNLLSHAPTRDSSAGLFSISDHESTTSMDTSPPPEECGDSYRETDSAAEMRSMRRRQPSPSAEVIDRDVWSIGTEEYEPDLQYSIADEILDMHQLMSKPFWANDQRWLASISCPVPQSRPTTPYSNEIINNTAGLIETIECIKAKDGEEEQARFAAAMRSRIAKFITNIRGACTAIWQHLFGNQTRPLKKVSLHEATVLRMQRFVIPRLVFALGQVFTLLCNEQPEVRDLVLFVLAEISIDVNRIAKVIKCGISKGKDDSDKIVEVEEFTRLLAAVQEWAKTEKDMQNEEVVRSIAL